MKLAVLVKIYLIVKQIPFYGKRVVFSKIRTVMCSNDFDAS